MLGQPRFHWLGTSRSSSYLRHRAEGGAMQIGRAKSDQAGAVGDPAPLLVVVAALSLAPAVARVS